MTDGRAPRVPESSGSSGPRQESSTHTPSTHVESPDRASSDHVSSDHVSSNHVEASPGTSGRLPLGSASADGTQGAPPASGTGEQPVVRLAELTTFRVGGPAAR